MHRWDLVQGTTLEKYKNEMFDKEQERPDSGYNRKAGGKELTLPNTQLCPLCYTFFLYCLT